LLLLRVRVEEVGGWWSEFVESLSLRFKSQMASGCAIVQLRRNRESLCRSKRRTRARDLF
jgi:hypothetical protein